MGETYRKSITAALLALIWVTGRGQTLKELDRKLAEVLNDK
jgi:hypothetical protein